MRMQEICKISGFTKRNIHYYSVAPIHCRYDVKEVMSMEQLQGDIDFLVKFTERFANAAVCPVAREIPEKIKKELDEYLARKRKEQ